MQAEIILLLIAKFGIPLAEQIYKTVTAADEPTPEMWAELRALNKKTGEEYIPLKP